MRLGQLARKLALRPSDIVEFLAENNIRIPEGANARLENDHVNLIMKRFVPGWTETLEVEAEPEEEVILPEAGLNSDQLNTEDHTGPTTEPVQEQELTEESNEVIRAPKIELSGLKVLGKIDLPEQKKKEDLPKEEGPVSESAKPEEGKPEGGKRERRENRRTFDVNKKRHQRFEKNPVALQREREANEAQKQHMEKVAREKEKRTQKYLQNYKPSAPTKATKLVKEDVVEMTPQDLVEPPKTIFGKILRWLTKAS